MRAEAAVTTADQRFPKALRLLKRRDFLRVQERGSKFNAEPLLVLVLKNPKGSTPRLGLTISSKVGNAVVRARLRRVLRELFRKRWRQWPTGLDVVVIARSAAKDASSSTLERAFEALTQKLRARFVSPNP